MDAGRPPATARPARRRDRGEPERHAARFDGPLPRHEEAALETVENGIMTGDLMLVATPDSKNRQVYTEEFIAEVAKRLKKKLE